MSEDAATKRSALIVAAFSSFITPFMVSSINIALPSIQREFSMNVVLLSWVPTSLLVTATVLLLPFGRLADIYGRKRTFMWGFVVFTAASALAGASISSSMLLLGRVLQGVGSAMIFATGIAIISSVFSAGERGRALGINIAAIYAGLSSGPFIGGFLTQHCTWRSIFFSIIPLGITAVVLIRCKLKGEWAEARGQKFDSVGSLIYGISLMAIMIGISLLPDLKSLWPILFGICSLFAFVRREMRIDAPVFDLNLFRGNRVFALSNLAALINYSATFAVTFLISLYLQYIKGLTPQGAGIVLVAQPIMMAVFSPFTGKLSDSVEPRLVASLGMAMSATGLFLFMFLSEETGLPAIVCNLILMGIGFALFSSPNINAVMGSVDSKSYGIASGFVGTTRLLGQMISMGIATSIFAVYIGRVQITVEYYTSFIEAVKTAFMVFSAICFAGIFASLARGKLLGNH
ncbi:MAG: MFS transporter [Syntrophobacteraceae bacterium]